MLSMWFETLPSVVSFTRDWYPCLPALNNRLFGQKERQQLQRDVAVVLHREFRVDPEEATAEGYAFGSQALVAPGKNQAYHRLHPQVHAIVTQQRIIEESDPIWREHFALCKKLHENLEFAPFLIECDDEDFLMGAYDTVIAESCYNVEDFLILHWDADTYEVSRWVNE